jgi:hypothetical protein
MPTVMLDLGPSDGSALLPRMLRRLRRERRRRAWDRLREQAPIGVRLQGHPAGGTEADSQRHGSAQRLEARRSTASRMFQLITAVPLNGTDREPELVPGGGPC